MAQSNEKHSPLAQFEIDKIHHIDFLGYDISFTNSTMFMLVAALVPILFFILSTKKLEVIPSKFQLLAEMLHDFLKKLLSENTAKGSEKFFPFVLTLYLFIICANLLGMIPYSFTVTSHIIITFALSGTLFLVILIFALLKHGVKFFTIFAPSGAPLWVLPLLVPIELFAFIVRPISLAIRLAANMTAGHIMLKIIAGFIIALGFKLGWLPFMFVFALIGFEIFVAILQAYIFTILACVYLNDAVELAH